MVISLSVNDTPHQFQSITKAQWDAGACRHKCAQCSRDFSDEIHRQLLRWPLVLTMEDCFIPELASEALREAQSRSVDMDYAVIHALAVLEECGLRRERLN